MEGREGSEARGHGSEQEAPSKAWREKMSVQRGPHPMGPLSSPAWEGPSPTNSPHPGGRQPPPHSVWRVCRKEAQHCANTLLRRQPSPDGPTLRQLRLLCEARPPACLRQSPPPPPHLCQACLPACLPGGASGQASSCSGILLPLGRFFLAPTQEGLFNGEPSGTSHPHSAIPL